VATHHHATLNTLAALEAAARELRHAIMTNQDTTELRARITTATAELAQQFGRNAPSPVTTPSTDASVTKRVTFTRPASKPTLTTTAGPAGQSTENITTGRSQPSTIDAPRTHVIKTVDMHDPIGPGWTLVQYEGDADASIWHVHHNGHNVGTVRRSYDLATNARGWEARTSDYDRVPAVGTFAASRRNDRLWRTRNSAAAGIAARVS
jgi:hypothetical protein